MSADFRHVFGFLYGEPWAILPEKFAEIERVVAHRLRTGTGLEFQAREKPVGSAEGGFQRVGDTAVINVFGVLTPRASIFSDYSGGTSAEQLGRSVDAAVADKSVKAIIFDVDSPGGSVYGIQEAAAKIAEASSKKRTIAVVNPVCASAAYWLASQAREIVMLPSGQVGSIGVMLAHTDESRAEDMAGLKTTFIASGEFKAELWKPLTPEAIAALQATSDEIYNTFVSAVARGRRTTVDRVKADMGKGRMLTAPNAIRAGMVDRTGTLESTLRGIATGIYDRPDSAVVRASLDRERMRRNVAADLALAGLPTR